MATAVKPIPTQSYRAKVTSKGQITVPVEIRRSLGVKPGDKIRFEQQEGGIRVARDTDENPFEKWRGIGNLGILGVGLAPPGAGVAEQGDAGRQPRELDTKDVPGRANDCRRIGQSLLVLGDDA